MRLTYQLLLAMIGLCCGSLAQAQNLISIQFTTSSAEGVDAMGMSKGDLVVRGNIANLTNKPVNLLGASYTATVGTVTITPLIDDFVNGTLPVQLAPQGDAGGSDMLNDTPFFELNGDLSQAYSVNFQITDANGTVGSAAFAYTPPVNPTVPAPGSLFVLLGGGIPLTFAVRRSRRPVR